MATQKQHAGIQAVSFAKQMLLHKYFNGSLNQSTDAEHSEAVHEEMEQDCDQKPKKDAKAKKQHGAFLERHGYVLLNVHI